MNNIDNDKNKYGSSFFQNSNFNNENLNNIKVVSYCPFCNSRYNPSIVKILEEKDEILLVFIKCPKCKSSNIVLIFIGPMGITSLNLLTDLNEIEVMSFRKNKPISEDTVLSIYGLLHNKKTEKQLINNLK